MTDGQNNNFDRTTPPITTGDSLFSSTANSQTDAQAIEILKDETIKAVEGFLYKEYKKPDIKQTNLEIDGSVESYTKLMQELNKTMDAKCTITQHEIDGPTPLGQQQPDNRSKILIRDARHTNGTKPEDLSESWMEVMAAQARGAVSLLDMNETTKSGRVANDADIKRAMAKTFGVYCERVRGAASPKERKKIVTEFNQELAGALQNHGLVIGGEELSKMKDAKVIQIMGDARDFCNLGEKDQSHVITISEDFEGKGNFIWASMKMNPLSEAIKAEYEQVRSYKNNRDSGIHQTPEWFINMKPHQRELTLEYLDQIMDGNHALPTQLRFLPGLKNAFADVKGFALNGKIDSKKSYVECHSGTLVHNAGSENSKEASRVTELNMRHAKELTGEREMVLSVLNTNSILQSAEHTICKISAEAASKVKGIKYNQNGVNLTALNPDSSLKRIEKFSTPINKTESNSKMLWSACKSGKDRTYALLMRGATTIFGSDKSKKFIEMLSKTNHAETMASGAGATRGAYGLKLKEMFIRMNDAILGAIQSRLTNTISGVNVLRTTKLHGDSVYKKMLNEERSKNNLQEPKKLASKNELVKIKALEVGHAMQETLASEPKIVVPAAPNAARPRARSL